MWNVRIYAFFKRELFNHKKQISDFNQSITSLCFTRQRIGIQRRSEFGKFFSKYNEKYATKFPSILTRGGNDSIDLVIVRPASRFDLKIINDNRTSTFDGSNMAPEN